MFTGKVYKIVCDCGCGKLYVGSTKQRLSKRMHQHRCDSQRFNSALYQHMGAIGKEHFRIVLLGEFECENKEQLRMHEDRFMQELDTIDNGYNGRRAHMTEEETKERDAASKKAYREKHQDNIRQKKKQEYHDNRELRIEQSKANYKKNKEHNLVRNKQYYQEHRDAILQQKKQYHEENKEAISKRAKEYYQANKEKIAARDKAYREANKDAIAQRMNRWREANNEALKEKRKQKYEDNKVAVKEQIKQYREANKDRYTCECCEYRTHSRANYNKHLNTAKHQRNSNQE